MRLDDNNFKHALVVVFDRFVYQFKLIEQNVERFLCQILTAISFVVPMQLVPSDCAIFLILEQHPFQLSFALHVLFVLLFDHFVVVVACFAVSLYWIEIMFR